MMTALRRGLLVLLAALPLFAQAAVSPHQLIQQTTDRLLADLKATGAVPQRSFGVLRRAERHPRSGRGCRRHLAQHHDCQIFA